MRDVEGEADEDTARRELAEEVGLRARRASSCSTSIYPSAGMTDSVIAIFLATDCTPVARAPHGPEEEHSEIFTVPLAEAIEWVVDGRIPDAKSVVGLLLAERRLRAMSTALSCRWRSRSSCPGWCPSGDGRRTRWPPTGVT